MLTHGDNDLFHGQFELFGRALHVAVALALRVGVQPQFSGDRVAQS